MSVCLSDTSHSVKITERIDLILAQRIHSSLCVVKKIEYIQKKASLFKTLDVEKFRHCILTSDVNLRTVHTAAAVCCKHCAQITRRVTGLLVRTPCSFSY